MRWWFQQHTGMPNQPPKAPRSAYALWFSRAKSAHSATGAAWNNKRDGKRLGAEWKELTAKADPVVDAAMEEFKAMRAQYEVNDAKYVHVRRVSEMQRQQRNPVTMFYTSASFFRSFVLSALFG